MTGCTRASDHMKERASPYRKEKSHSQHNDHTTGSSSTHVDCHSHVYLTNQRPTDHSGAKEGGVRRMIGRWNRSPHQGSALTPPGFGANPTRVRRTTPPGSGAILSVKEPFWVHVTEKKVQRPF